MSAETWTLAADWIRRDQSFSGEHHARFNLAVADWLDGLAARWSYDASGSEMDAADQIASLVFETLK